MQVWLKSSVGQFRLPVLPASYSVQSSQKNQTVNINALGEINLLGKRGLMEVSWSCFFPKRKESYCEYSNILSPSNSVTLIEKMKQNGIVQLVITGVPVSMMCTIESFQWGEQDGTGDISYDISLKEYRVLNIPSASLSTSNPDEETSTDDTTQRAGEPETASKGTYTVKKGDSLSTIARKMTGSASNWRKIYEQNKDTIGSNPNRISVGMKLIIP